MNVPRAWHRCSHRRPATPLDSGRRREISQLVDPHSRTSYDDVDRSAARFVQQPIVSGSSLNLVSLSPVFKYPIMIGMIRVVTRTRKC